MRLLWLKSDLLLPLDKGGKLRTWHLMRHLARRHEITYLAFAEQGTPAADVDGMRQVAARVETVERSEPAKGTLRFYLDAARHLADPLPYAVGKYRSPALQRRLARLLDDHTFDLLVCDFLAPAANAWDASSADRAEVTIVTHDRGETSRTRRVASMPSIHGMCTSIRTTSGWSDSASETASTPSFAQPTTSIRSSIPSVNIRASAKSAWSSTTRTRTVRCRLGTAVSFFRRIGGEERSISANLRAHAEDHSFE